MSSQVAKLASTVRGIGEATKKTGTVLDGFDKTFSKHAQSVSNALKGTTRKADQEVLNAIEDARKATKAATAALQNAARVCEKYAASI